MGLLARWVGGVVLATGTLVWVPQAVAAESFSSVVPASVDYDHSAGDAAGLLVLRGQYTHWFDASGPAYTPNSAQASIAGGSAMRAVRFSILDPSGQLAAKPVTVAVSWYKPASDGGYASTPGRIALYQPWQAGTYVERFEGLDSAGTVVTTQDVAVTAIPTSQAVRPTLSSVRSPRVLRIPRNWPGIFTELEVKLYDPDRVLSSAVLLEKSKKRPSKKLVYQGCGRNGARTSDDSTGSRDGDYVTFEVTMFVCNLRGKHTVTLYSANSWGPLERAFPEGQAVEPNPQIFDITTVKRVKSRPMNGSH